MHAPESLERRLNIIFAVVGLSAITLNLVAVDGFSFGSFLSAVEAASGLLITVLIFLVAVKIAARMDYGDFKKVFEDGLGSWVERNRFLVDEVKRVEGKEGKEFYFMLTKEHHANFVTEVKPACDFDRASGTIWHKGAFLYCDHRNEQVITFGLNKSFFTGRGGALPKGHDDLKSIAELLVAKLQHHFGAGFQYLNDAGKDGLSISINKEGTRIHVSLANLAKTSNNARILIDMVEYMKTAILTLA